MKENASKYSANPDKVVVMGGSAGGNLAVAITLSLADDPKWKPQGVLCACASTIDPDCIPEEYRSYWQPEKLLDSAMLNRTTMKPCLGKSFVFLIPRSVLGHNLWIAMVKLA
jgi:acetyl esterase/lipase